MSELHDLMAGHLKKVYGLIDGDSDFDVEAAIYWFASDYHGGQYSQLYEVLSESEFHPGSFHSSVKDEDEEAEMFYDELVKTFGPQTSRERAKAGFHMRKPHREFTPARWTLKEAQKTLKAVGMSISKKDSEYRVNYKGGKESTAYYTDDLSDAVATGKAMSADAATRYNV